MRPSRSNMVRAEEFRPTTVGPTPVRGTPSLRLRHE